MEPDALKAEISAMSAELVKIMQLGESELKSALELQGLPSTGSKSELVGRLRLHLLERMDAAMNALPESVESEPLEGPTTRSTTNIVTGKRGR
jgi:hypothetical protein